VADHRGAAEAREALMISEGKTKMAKLRVSPEFTKGLGQVLTGAKALYDFGVERGLTTPEQLRLTVAARQVEAKKLIASGMSQRKAAKALGISKSAVARDVLPHNGAKSAPKRGTSKPRKAVREVILEEEEPLVERIDGENPQNWLTAFMMRVDAATITANEAVTLIPNIFTETKPKKDMLVNMLQMSRHAGKLWEGIARELETRGVRDDLKGRVGDDALSN
jgi:hypothetical protein